LENDKLEQIKIAIRPRPNGTNLNEANEVGKKNNALRSVEERKEEYSWAQACIFSSSKSCDSDYLVPSFNKREKNSYKQRSE